MTRIQYENIDRRHFDFIETTFRSSNYTRIHTYIYIYINVIILLNNNSEIHINTLTCRH